MEEGSQSEPKEVFTPRPYQITLAQMAMQENTIIFLPTGSGKTFIAVLVMKNFLARDVRPFSQGGRRVVFVVNTVVLVEQQARVLERHLPISKAGRFFGAMNVDNWDKSRWCAEFETYEALVMTAEIFRMILAHGFISPGQISVAVFDECHRAVGDAPMQVAMRHILQSKERPRVIGLTATLINANADTELKAREIVKELLATFDAKIGHVSGEGVLCFSTKPKEYIIGYLEELVEDDPAFRELSEGQEFSNIIGKDDEIRSSSFLSSPLYKTTNEKIKKICKHIKNSLKDVELQFKNLGAFGGTKAAAYGIQIFEHDKIRVKSLGVSIQLSYAINVLTAVRARLEYKLRTYPSNMKPYKGSSDKVKNLLKVFQRIKAKRGDDICCLVLVQRKNTARILCTVLEHIAKNMPEYAFLKPTFLVGNSGSADPFGDDITEVIKYNKHAIKCFEEHQKNVLISTDVTEEGLDVPLCNCVVKFDKLEVQRSYMQSKGRARSIDSEYFIFTPDQKVAATEARVKLYQGLQNYLVQLVSGENVESDLDSSVDSYEVRCTYNSGNAMLTDIGAIPVLNKYCAMLTTDPYNIQTLDWERDGFTWRLSLPPMAPIRKTVRSDPHLGRRQGKRNAAFKMCVELHKCGELDDDLIPIPLSRKFVVDPSWFPQWNITEFLHDFEKGRFGTQKRPSLYLCKIPGQLSNCSPREGETAYLHFIQIEMKRQSLPNDRRFAILYECMKKSGGFAILSSKKMPQVCDFPVYMRISELLIKVLPNVQQVCLTQAQISLLGFSSWIIFNRMVNSSAGDMPENPPGGKDYLVVPVKTDCNGISIDWEAADNLVDLLMPFKLTKDERRQIVVTPEKYNGSVIIPWYKGLGKKVYVVMKIHNDMNGHSTFPETSQTFVERYRQHFDVVSIRPELPLLEAKPVSRHENAYLRRNDHDPISKATEELYLPDLCRLSPVSSTLWLKASVLPSILVRLERLLLAEELRCTIASETGVGHANSQSCKWLSLAGERSVGVKSKPAESGVSGKSPRGQFETASVSCVEAVIANRHGSEHSPIIGPTFCHLVEDLNINYLRDYFNLQSIRSTSYVNETVNEYEDVPQVPVPKISLLRAHGSPEGAQLPTVYTALAAPSALDVVNYERMETLGDSFLKIAVSLFLYEACPLRNEGLLTEIKGRLLGNRNLFCCALNKKLPETMFVNSFVEVGDWCPPRSVATPPKGGDGSSVKEDLVVVFPKTSPGKPRLEPLKSAQERERDCYLGTHKISDKTAADCVEALIGGYLLDCGWTGALELLVWLQVLPEKVKSAKSASIRIVELLQNGVGGSHVASPPPHGLACSREADALQKMLNYKFKDVRLLKQALTHATYDPQNSYERLEFIGDAVLDFLITSHIYEHCGLLLPGQLTDLRSALVNNVTLAAITVKHGLNRYLLFNSPLLLQAMDSFISTQRASNHKIDSDVLILFEDDDMSLSDSVFVPKVLADVFEALAGAIFFDSNRNLDAVWKALYPLMHDVIQTFSKDIPINATRKLYEYLQDTGKSHHFVFNYDAKNMRSVATCIVDGVRYHGYGTNKKTAKMAASKLALHSLKTAEVNSENVVLNDSE